MESIFIEIEKGNHAAVRQWLAEKKDVDYADKRKRTLLMHSAMAGHESIVKMLIEAGASLTASDQYGYIPPFFACHMGGIECVRLFIDQGIPVNSDISGCREKETFLLMASSSNSPELITYLLNLGADVNATSRMGVTPLMRAAYKGHSECCLLLLNAGANILAVTGSGKHDEDALAMACRQGHEETSNLLLNHGAPCTDASFFGAIDSGLLSIVNRLLQMDSELVKARGHLDTTPLIAAVETGLIPMVKLLLDAGAEIDDQDGDKGWSPLMHATYCDDKEMITFLLKSGANEKLKDKSGKVAADLSDDFYDYDAD